MNVQRFTDGKLRPITVKDVLFLPHPVEFIRTESPVVTDDPTIWPSHRTHTLVRDTEITDFHAQRMTIVR